MFTAIRKAQGSILSDMFVNKMYSTGCVLEDFEKVDKQLSGYAQLKMKTHTILKVPARGQQRSFQWVTEKNLYFT